MVDVGWDLVGVLWIGMIGMNNGCRFLVLVNGLKVEGLVGFLFRIVFFV